MRKNVIILCIIFLMVIVFFSGCITQNTGYPVATPTPQAVNVNSPITPPPLQLNVNLPIASPTPQIVYVTVTVPASSQTMVTLPVPTQTSAGTVCNGIEQSTADIRIIGSVYGLASSPAAGIDEIRFTIGLDSCSSAIDLTKLQIGFSTLDAPPITLTQSTRTSTGFFTTKIGTTKVTSLNPGDLVEITFYVTPIPANTKMNFELKPSEGAPVPFSKTVPATISAMNVLW